MHALATSSRAPDASSAVLAAGVGLAIVLVLTRPDPVGGALAFSVVPASAAAAIDARTGRLPDQLLAAALLPTLIWVTASAFTGDDAALHVAIGAVTLGVPVLAVHLVAPPAIGFGDVKLAAVLGAAVGMIDPRLALVALCLASAVAATYGLLTRRSAVPLGPALTLSAAAVIVLAPAIDGAVSWR